MAEVTRWWCPEVYHAFLEAVGRPEARRHLEARTVSDEDLGAAAA
jgi:hypothetical protein